MRTRFRTVLHRIRRWLPIGAFIAAVTLSAVIGGFLLRDIRRLIEAEAWVAHTHQVSDGLGALLATVNSRAAGQLGYVATGNVRYLEDYRAADSADGGMRQLERLRELISDNPAQQRRLDRLTERLREYNRVFAEVEAAAGIDAAREVLQASGQAQIANKVRATIDEMGAAERTLLTQRMAKAGRHVLLTFVELTAIAILSASAVGAALVALAREVRQRSMAQRTLATMNASLEGSVRARTEQLGAANAPRSAAASPDVVALDRSGDSRSGRSPGFGAGCPHCGA